MGRLLVSQGGQIILQSVLKLNVVAIAIAVAVVEVVDGIL